MDWPSIALGVAALAVSAWAVIESRRTSKSQRLLQERLFTLESARERDRVLHAKRAQLEAAIVHLGSDYRLVVQNSGEAEARAVKVLVDDKSLAESGAVLLSKDEEVTLFGPGVQVRYIMPIVMGSPMRYDVQLEWEDDSGQPGRWRSQLRI